jgi:energy-coupling factor transporter ATP-binding protein EcfA2
MRKKLAGSNQFPPPEGLRSVRFFVHNMLMIGPTGAGKTLLARALAGILPEMSMDEALDVAHNYSVADALPPDTPMIRSRSFRSPHRGKPSCWRGNDVHSVFRRYS